MSHSPPRAWSFGFWSFGFRWLPAVLVAAVVVGLLSASGVAVFDLGAFFAAYGWTVLLPGFLVYRLVASGPTLLTDLALASATGLVGQLGAYFVTTGLGISWAIWFYPALLLAAALGVPAWRERLRFAYQPGSIPASWLMALASVGTTISAWSGVWRASDLPPAANDWYQDLYYFLGNAAEAGRTITPLAPQTATYPLDYHWYSSAHMAALAQASGVGLPEIVTRLWAVPVSLTILGLLVALAVRCGGAQWHGALAGVLTTFGATLMAFPEASIPDFQSFVYLSPSLIYSVALALLAADLILAAALGQLTWAAGLLLLAVGLALPGAKVSALPPLLCGLGLAWVVARLRRQPARSLGLALVCLLPGVGVSAAAALGVGAAAGSTISPFVTIGRTGPWLELAGAEPTRGFAGLIATPTGWLVLGLVTATFLVQFAWLTPGLRFGRTAVGQILLGTIFAGLCGMLLVNQVGLSQVYFLRGVLVFGYLAACLGLRAERKSLAWGLALGVPTGLATWWTATWPTTLVFSWTGQGILLAGLLAGLFVAWRRPEWRAAAAWALVLAALVSSLPGSWPKPDPPRLSEAAVTDDETRAARELTKLAQKPDLVATNVHCRSKLTKPECDARTFWVSGLSERRVLIEGWAYLAATQSRAGTDGLPSYRQPYPDTEVFAENEAVFYQPSAAAVARLRDRGVRWLFADELAGPVSPKLGQFATEKARFGPVTIYEIP